MTATIYETAEHELLCDQVARFIAKAGPVGFAECADWRT